MNANALIGTHDVLLLTLDTLRFDVAVRALASGQTPTLQRVLPHGRWEKRHTPGSFTYAAHQAFFAGFLPTPATPGRHPRLFATRFPGSETSTPDTCVFDSPDLVTGLAARGYHTVCVGGVGFFNQQSALGQVLPSLFHEAHWSPELGVTNLQSTEAQVTVAVDALERVHHSQRAFVFVNVSAMHQPNRGYLPGATEDSPDTQRAALAYVDTQLAPLFRALGQRGPSLCIICSDHGTAYGEDGYHGHRLAHEVVWTVPYAELILPKGWQ